MSAELFYLVGKPNRLKQALISVMRETLSDHRSIIVPQIYTTNKEGAESDNYCYVDERNFLLRESMGIYSLHWKKKDCYFGVSGDLTHRLNSGVDVILNGSIHNLEAATKQFPNLNAVIIQKQGNLIHRTVDYYPIAEDADVRLEWNSKDASMGHPYVLTLLSEDGMDRAKEMLLNLISYNRYNLEDVV